MTKMIQNFWIKKNLHKILLVGFIFFFVLFGANLKNNFLGNIFTPNIEKSIFKNVSNNFENILDKKIEKVGDNLYKITVLANEKGGDSIHSFKFLLEIENNKIKKIIKL